MRRQLIATLALTGLILAACGGDDDDSSDDDDGGAAAGGACADPSTIEDGVLTVATSEPAFPPYVADNDPTNGLGFESAVAYAVAKEMGFEEAAVEWVRTTFDEAIQPGAKNFDFNIQQFSITPERAESVTFSDPYFTSNQAVVGLVGSAAEGVEDVEALQALKFGVQAGTTSLAFVNDVIQPDQEVFVYDDNVLVKAAMEANQIDAAVFDLPTAIYVSAVEIPNSAVVAQFPLEAGGAADEFGLVLEKGNDLVDCVNAALGALEESGDLQFITDQYMVAGDVAPVIRIE